jgi:tocopherol O-methyltransferase
MDVWGEDMHHGYYPHPSYSDHRAAQIDMIDRSLDWGFSSENPKPENLKTFVDVGCGVGGSSRHIARKWGLQGVGISLSPFQIQKANEITSRDGLGGLLGFKVADAMAMPFEDNSFDLGKKAHKRMIIKASSFFFHVIMMLCYVLTAWSMESAEHMPDKRQFMSELVRIVRPGGRLLIVTWCHRELQPGEESLSPRELRLLEKINRGELILDLSHLYIYFFFYNYSLFIYIYIYIYI